MNQKIRKTIDFSPGLYEQIKAYGKVRSCMSFSETIRDIVRSFIDSRPSQNETNYTENTEVLQSGGVPD